jgi:SOS-response transcriptional repressor LexA
MSVKITKKQQRILDFITDFIDKNGVSPTYREIAAGLELKSVASVAEHVDNLVFRGALRRSEDHGRVLEVVDLTFPETTALFKSHMAYATEEEKNILRKAAKILGVDEIENEENYSDPCKTEQNV